MFLFVGVDFAVALQLAVAHAFHKLTCIGAKAFHVAALSLGVEVVVRPRRLAGARNAGNNNEFVVGYGHIDVLKSRVQRYDFLLVFQKKNIIKPFSGLTAQNRSICRTGSKGGYAV